MPPHTAVGRKADEGLPALPYHESIRLVGHHSYFGRYIGRARLGRPMYRELLRSHLGSFVPLGLGPGISIIIRFSIRADKRTKDDNRHKPAHESCHQVRYQDGGEEEVHFGSSPEQEY